MESRGLCLRRALALLLSNSTLAAPRLLGYDGPYVSGPTRAGGRVPATWPPRAAKLRGRTPHANLWARPSGQEAEGEGRRHGPSWVSPWLSLPAGPCLAEYPGETRYCAPGVARRRPARMSPPPPTRQVFVSHSATDRAAAEAIRAALAMGMSTYLPMNSIPAPLARSIGLSNSTPCRRSTTH